MNNRNGKNITVNNVKQFSARIGMLKRARDFVKQDVLISMYNSLVFLGPVV